MIPIMRCIPTRQLMQRMVRRASALPNYFMSFEQLNSYEI